VSITLISCRCAAIRVVKSTQAEANLFDSATQHSTVCVQFARSPGDERRMRVLQRALRTRLPLLCISMRQCAVSVAMAVGSAPEGEGARA
jgi:hypothetical protein